MFTCGPTLLTGRLIVLSGGGSGGSGSDPTPLLALDKAFNGQPFLQISLGYATNNLDTAFHGTPLFA